jgi:RNA polymerase sigma factor (TIGR02999 family)
MSLTANSELLNASGGREGPPPQMATISMAAAAGTYYISTGMDQEEGAVTQLLRSLAAGRREVIPQLVELVYVELRTIARARMNGEQAGHILTPTGLVHEAYLRLASDANPRFQNRAHFFAVAARAMRRILVDHARARDAAKRDSAQHGSGPGSLTLPLPLSAEQILALNDALRALAELSPRQCEVVELRYFAGLTEEEVAEVLGVTRRTVNRDWALARTWLHRRMQSPNSHDA